MLPSMRYERLNSNTSSTDNAQNENRADSWFIGPIDDQEDTNKPTNNISLAKQTNTEAANVIDGMYIRIPKQQQQDTANNDVPPGLSKTGANRFSSGVLSDVSSKGGNYPESTAVLNSQQDPGPTPPKFISLTSSTDGSFPAGHFSAIPADGLDGLDELTPTNDLLYEGQNYLAMSMLIYMFAQLREMAILGYTHADFRTIDVNSTHPWTPPPPTQSEQEATGKRRFFRRMAISMKSLNYQVTPPTVSPDEELEGQRRFPRRGAMRYVPPPPSHVQNDDPKKEQALNNPAANNDMPNPIVDDDASVQYSLSGMSLCSFGKNVEKTQYLLNTMSAGKMIRIVLDELDKEENKDEIAQKQDSYDKMGFQEHDVSMIKEFQRWVEDSRKKQLDDAAVTAIKEIRKKVTKKKSRANRRGGLIERISSKLSLRGAVVGDAESVATNDVTESEDIRESIERRRKSFDTSKQGKKWFSLQRTLIQDHFGVKPELNMAESDFSIADNSTSAAQKSRKISTEHISQDMINNVIDSSLPSYFQEGSVVSQMLRSGIEVVWFGDRHPKEAIYCLCVNRATKTVTVVFRGSVTAHNWVRNLQIVMTDHQNPIWEENYEGWDNMISLHTGFSLYLLRRRKIDGSRKLDEIFSRVNNIGHELDGDGNYRVCVTGHSLGGALATIFSFYAAADERFTKIGPVRTFTYASPRVGDLKFLHAYQQLERTGRLLHARFANVCDIVPLVPTFSLEGFLIGQWYKHVGLHIALHGCGWGGKYLVRRAQMVSYVSDHGWWGFIKSAIRSNFISNLTTVKNYANNHRPNEYQIRLNFACQVRLSLAEKENRRMYTLEEYYRRKANFKIDENGDVSELASRANNMFTQNTILFFIYAVILIFVTQCVFSFLIVMPDTTRDVYVKNQSDPIGLQKSQPKVEIEQPPHEIIATAGFQSLEENQNQISKEINTVSTVNETGKGQHTESEDDVISSISETLDVSKTAFTSIGSWAQAEDIEWNVSFGSNSDFMPFVKARSSDTQAIYRYNGEATQHPIEKSTIKDLAHANTLKTIRNARVTLKETKRN